MPVPDQAGNVRDVDNGPGGENGPGRRRAGRFVQSGSTTFFPVPVLRTSTTGRTVTFIARLSPGPAVACSKFGEQFGRPAIVDRLHRPPCTCILAPLCWPSGNRQADLISGPCDLALGSSWAVSPALSVLRPGARPQRITYCPCFSLDFLLQRLFRHGCRRVSNSGSYCGNHNDQWRVAGIKQEKA
jgi:hypothetical protein